NFNWALGSPDPSLAVDSFSIRWEGYWDFPAGGSYRFSMTSDDGMRVWVDNVSVLDAWMIQPPTTYLRDFTVASGRHYVRVDYYEHTGNAVAQAAWVYQGTSLPVNGFRGRYYGTETFTDLRIERVDSAINFPWGLGSPGPVVPVDSFSVRWEGNWDFASGGTYRFTLTTDDGMRMWIDNASVLDNWNIQPPTTYVRAVRSEEHTSELQSRFDLVCRLLLEKKKHTTVT